MRPRPTVHASMTTQWPVVLVVSTLAFFAAANHATAQDGQQPPREIRETIEGTWELLEWHVNGEVVRPPQMEGRWMANDGTIIRKYRKVSEG